MAKSKRLQELAATRRHFDNWAKTVGLNRREKALTWAMYVSDPEYYGNLGWPETQRAAILDHESRLAALRNPRSRNPVENKHRGYKAILVKRVARGMKAYDSDNNSVTVSYDFGKEAYENAAVAAEALQEKMKWSGTLVGGHTKDGWAFTFRDEDDAKRSKNPRKRKAAKRKKNPGSPAFVIALYMGTANKRLTYDANRNRFTDNSKPSLYATQIAAKNRAEILLQNNKMLNAYRVTVEPATEAERGSVYGARVRRGNPDFPAARSGGPLWEYKDARGVTVRGRVEKTFDKGGTDVTYMMRRETGEMDMLSGSRLKAAKVLRENPSPKRPRRNPVKRWEIWNPKTGDTLGRDFARRKDANAFIKQLQSQTSLRLHWKARPKS